MSDSPAPLSSLRDAFHDRFALGAWYVEPKAGLLRRGDTTVHLEPKVMEVLLALAVEQGEVVSRDRLFDLVWPDVVVTDSALNRSISDLRRVLGDDARQPRYIKTVPKVGYQLLAPVKPLPSITGDGDGTLGATPALFHDAFGASRPVEEAPPSQAAPPIDGPPASESPARPTWGLGMAAGVVVVAVLLAWWSRPPSLAETLASAEARVLTTIPGSENQGMLSPDGTRIAFVTSWPDQTGRPALYVQSLTGSTPRRLVDNADWPAWSPDGSQLAFQRPIPGTREGAIYVVTAYGTDEQRVIEGDVKWGGLSWSPDGASLAYVGTRDEEPSGIHLLDLETGARKRLTTPTRSAVTDMLPAFSPDGEWIAFLRWTDPAMSQVYVVPAAGGEPVRVTDKVEAIAGLTWAPDGDAIVFSSNRTGLYRLWSVSPGEEPQPLTVPAQDPGNPTFSATGLLAFAEWRYDTNVWVAPAGDGADARAVMVTTLWDEEPALSPSGDRVAFVSTRSGFPELWAGSLNGGAPRLLTDFGGGALHAPRWSPTGRAIAFQARVDGDYEVFVVAAEGGTPRAVAAGPGDDINPRWSRDGRFVYFGSERDGEWDVWRVAAEGGAAERVTHSGAFVAEEDATGDGLYVMHPRQDGLYHVDPASDDVPRLVADLPWFDWHNWTSTSAGLFALDRSQGARRIVVHGPEGARPVSGPLSNLTHFRATISVSDDGRMLAWGRVDRAENDLMVLEP